MFCAETETVKARKPHTCTWCGQQINPGDTYKRWNSVDGKWFTNKMHPECHEACDDECREWGEYEYTPYTNERPEKVKHGAENG